MSWEPPSDDGGAPILYYNVKEQRKGAQQRCDTNTCVFRKLKNGGSYSFRVQAVNRVGPGEWSEESVQARADTEPGRVENIRMVDRGDGTITVAWDKPRTADLEGPGLRPDVARRSADGVRGDQLRGARSQQQREVHLHRAGAQQGRLLGAQVVSRDAAAGYPGGARAADGHRPRDQAASQTALRIAWPAHAARRARPDGLHASATPPVPASAASPGARRSRRLACTHSGIPYDGRDLHLHRAGPQPPGKQPPHPARSLTFEAVGRPAAGGTGRSPPTGGDQEVQLQYTVPGLAGHRRVAVEILVGGWSARTLHSQTGSIATRVPRPSNEQPSPVQLRVCNENAAGGVHAQRAAERADLRPSRRTRSASIAPPCVNGKERHLDHQRDAATATRRSCAIRSTAAPTR